MFLSEDEVVSIGDSGSDNELDENNHSFNENHFNKNGFDYPAKKSKLMVIKLIIIKMNGNNRLVDVDTNFKKSIIFLIFLSQSDNHSDRSMPPHSPAPYLSILPKSTAITKQQQPPQMISERKTMNTALDALLQAIDTSNAINDAQLTPNNIQLEILKEIRKANAMAELERREAKMLHQEMRELEEQRFNLTQMFIERSLTLQKQMLDSLRSGNRGSGSGGGVQKSTVNGGSGSGSSSDNSFKFSSRQQSNRPQFILAKKKK